MWSHRLRPPVSHQAHPRSKPDPWAPHEIRAPRSRLRQFTHFSSTLCTRLAVLMTLMFCVLIPLESLKAEKRTEGRTEKERIAVLDFRDEASLAPFERALLADSVRGAALSTPFDVMTKENITALLPPDVALEDCVGECEVEVGRQIGAHYVVTGVVGRVTGELRLLLRLYETRLGALRAQAEAKANTAGELQPKARASALRLFSQLAPTQSASVKTQLWVKVSPKGAKVTLDGFLLDPSQARPVRGEAGGQLWPISEGQHLLKASAPGYLPERRRIKVREGQPAEAIFKLKRRVGARRCTTSRCEGDLWVYTRPPGAEVSVIGQDETYIASPNSMNPRVGSVALRLPEGKHWVRARLGGRSAERLVSVKGGEANLEMRSKPMTLRRARARLSLSTSPQGALVRLNGEVIGKTPVRKHALKPGAYWVEVVAEGRQSREQLVVLDDKVHWRETWRLVVNTSALKMKVSFEGAPISGASVWLSGQRLGETDEEGLLSVTGLPVGDALVEVRHPHYMPHQRAISFKAGEERSARVSLEGAWAELSVSVDEASLKALKARYEQETGAPLTFTAIWAGKELGALPIQGKRVMAGRRWLQVRASDEALFEPYRDQLTLEVGASRDEQVKLSALKGDLSLSSSPPNARVSVNGQAFGKTPFRERLPAGVHQLKMEVDGHPPYEKTLLLSSKGHEERVDFRARTYVRVRCDPMRGEVTINGLLRGPSPQLIDLTPGEHEIGCQLYGANVTAPVQLSPGEQLTQRLTLSSASINFARWRRRWTPRIGKGLMGAGALATLSSLLLWLGPQRSAERARDALAKRWLEAKTPDELSERYRVWSQANQEVAQMSALTQLSLWGGLTVGAGGGLLWWSSQPTAQK